MIYYLLLLKFCLLAGLGVYVLIAAPAEER